MILNFYSTQWLSNYSNYTHSNRLFNIYITIYPYLSTVCIGIMQLKKKRYCAPQTLWKGIGIQPPQWWTKVSFPATGNWTLNNNPYFHSLSQSGNDAKQENSPKALKQLLGSKVIEYLIWRSRKSWFQNNHKLTCFKIPFSVVLICGDFCWSGKVPTMIPPNTPMKRKRQGEIVGNLNGLLSL